ncbi:MAG: hypothetical protein LUQ65_12645, partial [Candidatus Helarchaeota archaeon]|nr:hypothetical protein [Candidatus Helarchaeota archaeon]
TAAPTYVDPGGDSLPSSTDVLKVWIGNTATHLQFKFELNGSLDRSIWPLFFVYISYDNVTGSDYGWELPTDALIDFEIGTDGYPYSYFQDYNTTNNLGNIVQVGMLYYKLSNNNHTLELGYKFKTYYGGCGYLNVSIGQTIYLKLQASQDSDYIPDSTLVLRYILTEEAGGIPGFGLPFLSFAVLAVITVFLLAKKKATI